MGKLEALEERVALLRGASREKEFTEYLEILQNRIRREEATLDQITQELDQSCRLYQTRLAAREASSDYMFFGAEYTGDAGTAKETLRTGDAGTARETLRTGGAGAVKEPMRAGDDCTVKETMHTGSVDTMGEAKKAGPEDFFRKTEKAPAHVQPKKAAELRIADFLSLVGGVFLLTALVLLGMNFMDGFWKGLSLYLFAAVFLLVSELVVRRKFPRLCSVFSAIGIGGLYAATIVNYAALKNFGAWVTIFLILAVTAGVFFLAYRRESFFYRYLGLTACYVSFFPVQSGLSDVEFLVVSGILLVVNLVCIVFPDRGNRRFDTLLHLSIQTVFAAVFWMQALFHSVDDGCLMIFVLSSAAAIQALYAVGIRWRAERQADTLDLVVAYCLGMAVHLLLLMFTPAGSGALGWIAPHVDVAAVVLLCGAAVAALWKYEEKWYPYIFLLLRPMAEYVLFGDTRPVWFAVGCLVVLLALSRLAAWGGERLPTACDGVVTAVACATCLFHLGSVPGGVLAAVLFVSVLAVRGWKLYQQVAIAYTVAFFAQDLVPEALTLPIFVGTLYGMMLLYHFVGWLNCRRAFLRQLLLMAGQAVAFLQLASPVYRNAYLTYLFMLVFGLAAIFLLFQEQSRMELKWKRMVLAVFLTYMALVFRTGYPIVNSILLMVTALICVGDGFVERVKPVRVYGLVLSLAVCGKIALLDFFSVSSLQKTILFFVAGVIALGISGIYIILEKKLQDELEEKRQEE